MNKSDMNFIAFNMFLAKSEYKDLEKNGKLPHSGKEISKILVMLGYILSIFGVPGLFYGLILSYWKIKKGDSKFYYYDSPSRKKLETIAGVGLIASIFYFLKWLMI